MREAIAPGAATAAATEEVADDDEDDEADDDDESDEAVMGCCGPLVANVFVNSNALNMTRRVARCTMQHKRKARTDDGRGRMFFSSFFAAAAAAAACCQRLLF